MAALWFALALLLIYSHGGLCKRKKTSGLAPTTVPPLVKTLTAEELHGIVTPLRNTYGSITPELYSFAAAIPKNAQGKYEANSVITTNPSLDVQRAYNTCQVYSNELRLVAATKLRYDYAYQHCRDQEVSDQMKTIFVRTWADVERQNVSSSRAEHAEFRVLKRVQATISNLFNSNDLMIVYCLKTPCINYCMRGSTSTITEMTNASPPSIIGFLTNAIKKWTKYRYVFTELYDNARESLQKLGSVIGLENVYRCTDTECFCCKGSHGSVLQRCYQDNITNIPGASAAGWAG